MFPLTSLRIDFHQRCYDIWGCNKVLITGKGIKYGFGIAESGIAELNCGYSKKRIKRGKRDKTRKKGWNAQKEINIWKWGCHRILIIGGRDETQILELRSTELPNEIAETEKKIKRGKRDKTRKRGWNAWKGIKRGKEYFLLI